MTSGLDFPASPVALVLVVSSLFVEPPTWLHDLP